MSILSSLFGDPTIKVLHRYQKDLLKIKKIEEDYRKTIDTIEAVQNKTQEFRDRFTPIRLRYITEQDSIDNNTSLSLEEKTERVKKNHKNYISEREEMVQSLRFEAIALHRRACEIIFGQEFILPSGNTKIWNMIPFDVQIL